MGPSQSVTEYNVDFQQALTDLAEHVADEQRISSNVTSIVYTETQASPIGLRHKQDRSTIRTLGYFKYSILQKLGDLLLQLSVI
jgi:hypothetical protein